MVARALACAALVLPILSSATILPRDDLGDITQYGQDILSQLPLYTSECDRNCTGLNEAVNVVCAEAGIGCWCNVEEEGNMHECAKCLLIASNDHNKASFRITQAGHKSYHAVCTRVNGDEYHRTRPAPDTPATYGADNNKTSQTKVIVGATVGGVVGLAVIALAAFFIHRRTRKRKPQAVQRVEFADPSIADYVDSASPSNPVPYLEPSAASYGYPAYSTPPPSDQKSGEGWPYTPPPPESPPMSSYAHHSHTLSWSQSPYLHSPYQGSLDRTSGVASPGESMMKGSFPIGLNTDGRFSGVAEPEMAQRR